MEELIRKLNEIPNAYFGFVAGVIAYARKTPERLETVLAYVDNTDDLTPSDVIRFLMLQPDFHDDGLGLKEMIG